MGEYASSLCSLIEASSDKTIQQQYASEVKPFGFTRILAMKIFLAIVKEGNISWTAHFGSLFSILLSYTQDYPWNSALHKIIEEIFITVLKSNSDYDLGSQTAFLEETNFFEFASEFNDELEFEDSKRSLRAGSISSINIIGNIFKTNLREELTDLAFENDDFMFFHDKILVDSNNNNEQPLAGHSTANDEDDDDSDDNHYETSMDKLFATFTQVKESYDSSRSQSSEN